tara:strand:+ start:1136 stop:1411 length:276 start_codon:yes stop_codon:yes gene_type:complete
MRTNIIDGVVVPMTSEEISAREAEEQAWADGQADRYLAELRTERNSLLAETDFFGNSDVTMSDSMATYRQKLRDITKTATSLNDVTWPTKP